MSCRILFMKKQHACILLPSSVYKSWCRKVIKQSQAYTSIGRNEQRRRRGLKSGRPTAWLKEQGARSRGGVPTCRLQDRDIVKWKTNRRLCLTCRTPKKHVEKPRGHLIQLFTRTPASADRTARVQFQATGQSVSRTQASDAMTSRMPPYEVKCVQRRCFQCGSVPLRSDI